jgi:hypothetical protein
MHEGEFVMAAQTKPMPDPMESNSRDSGSRSDACESAIDRNAPAGSPTSLGSKSDCNGRPATDSSVVEGMDEAGPLRKANPDSAE